MSGGAPDLADVQGGILHGYRSLPHATILWVHGETAASLRGCLSDLLPLLTDATRPAAPRSRAVNVAVTYGGFERLELSGPLLDRFPRAFREGPVQRAASLGDVGPSQPSMWPGPFGTGHVHLVVTARAPAGGELPDVVAEVVALIRGAGASVVGSQDMHAMRHMVEHFGFADGTSQPAYEGVPPSAGPDRTIGVPVRHPSTPAFVPRLLARLLPRPPDRPPTWRPIRLGELLLGHPDEDGLVVTMPDADLVRNGTYAVYRKLRQHVGDFRAAVAQAADELGISEEYAAAKVVGRWRDGVPVGPEDRAVEGSLAHTSVYPPPPNDFTFLPHDRAGEICPRGAHIRRANPRDALDVGSRVTDPGRLTARHRIVRRGLPYGPPLPEDAVDDALDERGLMFVCFNADLERQFETVQRAWCTDGDPFRLGADQDFLLGNEQGTGKMTIPVAGQRCAYVTSPADLVTTRMTEYAFMPGLTAVRALAGGAYSGSG